MHRIPDCTAWISLAVILTLAGCVRPATPGEIRIIASPQVAGCGEYASDMAVDLRIHNLGTQHLNFDVLADVRDSPVLFWDSYSVLDVIQGESTVDKRLSPGPLLPAGEIADHATISGHDDGLVVALLNDVRPEDYRKSLRIELRDPQGHHFLSEPFSGSLSNAVVDTVPILA